MVVNPALLYGVVCYPIKRTQVQRLMVAEMRVLESVGENRGMLPGYYVIRKFLYY